MDGMARNGRNSASWGVQVKQPKNAVVDIELFAGAGGLTLGLAAAGLAPNHLFEQNKHCCNTLRENALGKRPHITGQIHEEDIAETDWSAVRGSVRVLSGGPPCQPFSLGGKHLAHLDGRDQFPATLRAIRELKPAIVLLENVPGLARDSFRPHLEYLVRQLTRPSLGPKKGELWEQHDRRLQREAKDGELKAEYNMSWWVINAADFGVAQARVRVVFVGTRRDLPAIEPLLPTHSRAALIQSQESGEYWRSRGIRKKLRDEWPRRVHGASVRLDENYQPWRTVRDCLVGLPVPSKDSCDPNSHFLIPGARLYQHHSGSELDWPAKTIKAGVHGVAGGENVILLDNGHHRYFTLREMARLQGFPDDYRFTGPRSRIIGQIGNAVPVGLARVLGEQLRPAMKAFEKSLGKQGLVISSDFTPGYGEGVSHYERV